MTSRSSFPQSVDAFVELSNILSSDKASVDRYQILLMQLTRTIDEETELNNLKTTLANKLVDAEFFNKLSDAIVAVQDYFLNTVMTDIKATNVGTLQTNLTDTTNRVNNHLTDTSDPHLSYAQAVAWAKSYGLGDVAQDWSNKDLNALNVTGFYRGSNMVNSYSFQGGNSSKWQYVIHIKHDSVYQAQISIDFDTGQMATRVARNGVWQNWRLSWDSYSLPYSSLVMAKGDIPNTQDINWMFDDGVYSVYSNGSNHSSFPPNIYPYGTLMIFSSNSTKTQIYCAHNNGQMWMRTTWGNNQGINWTGWRNFVAQGDWLKTDRVYGATNPDKFYFGNQNFGFIDSQAGAVRFHYDDNSYYYVDQNTASIYIQGFGVFAFKKGDNPGHSFIQAGTGLQFLANNAGVQVRTYDDNAYAPMYASSFSPPSNREIKKNIVPFEENATDLIMNTQIYNYQYDNELDGELPHTGIIVDEAPVWTVDPRGKGVDLYAMVSLAWKSNQELAQRVTDLENRLLALESK